MPLHALLTLQNKNKTKQISDKANNDLQWGVHGLVDGDSGVDGDGARDEDGVREDAQTLNHHPLLVRNSAVLPLERAQAPRPLALLLEGRNSYE